MLITVIDILQIFFSKKETSFQKTRQAYRNEKGEQTCQMVSNAVVVRMKSTAGRTDQV